jgi:NADP-dependent 3-hydroxy acid dehydrogenase YdfG
MYGIMKSVKIKDKIAIVTGASSGIGLSSAKLLTQMGATVILVSRSAQKLKEISGSLPRV